MNGVELIIQALNLDPHLVSEMLLFGGGASCRFRNSRTPRPQRLCLEWEGELMGV